jgi:hypothetical protein
LVKISYGPLNEIIVHQYVKYESPEALARTVVVQVGSTQSVSLSWVDNIAFKILSPPFVISELLSKEFVEGKLHISILYAEMNKFKPSIHTSEEKLQVPVLDESGNNEARAIVDWLKGRSQ